LNETVRNATADAGARRLSWKVFGVLMAGALIGTWAVLPYYLALVEFPSSLPVPLWLLLAAGTAQNLLLFAAVTGLGLWLGGKVGLGAPVLRAWLAGEAEAPRRFRASLPLCVGTGVVVGILIVLLEQIVFAPLLPGALDAIAPPAPWQGFLASFYGGINEELLTRLGLMTLLVWAATRLVRQGRPSVAVMWTANALAALLFAVGHLPTLAMLAPLTVILVVRTLLLNGVAGGAFGWLYWRRGLLAAMVAHFSADIVLHAVLPAFG
jgi:membrane protease YdiL (CAAX protease family)